MLCAIRWRRSGGRWISSGSCGWIPAHGSASPDDPLRPPEEYSKAKTILPSMVELIYPEKNCQMCSGSSFSNLKTSCHLTLTPKGLGGWGWDGLMSACCSVLCQQLRSRLKISQQLDGWSWNLGTDIQDPQRMHATDVVAWIQWAGVTVFVDAALLKSLVPLGLCMITALLLYKVSWQPRDPNHLKRTAWEPLLSIESHCWNC